VRRQGDVGRVNVAAVTPNGGPATGLVVRATVTTPANVDRSLRLRETVPGSYQGSFVVDGAGNYHVAVEVPGSGSGANDSTGGGAVWKPASADLYASYPGRYALESADPARLEALAAVTGGRVLPGTEPLFPGSARWRVATHRLPQLWLLLALAVFMTELTMRYLSLRAWWAALRALALRRGQRKPGAPRGESPSPGA